MAQGYWLTPAEMTWKAGTPYSERYRDIYHSSAGPEEKSHVFLKPGLLSARFQALPRASPGHFQIVELGFGTGINFLLTADLWRSNAPDGWRLHYFAVDHAPPRQSDLGRSLAALADNPYTAELLRHFPDPVQGLHRRHFAHQVDLTLAFENASAAIGDLHSPIDAIFLDGFSPRRNPDMWSEPICRRLGELARPGATISTYTAAGNVMKALDAAGFVIAKARGHGRKRHMLVGRKPGSWAPRTRTTSGPAVVVGAGLAGCWMANALAGRGFDVVLLEQNQRPAGAASGMGRMVFYPQLTTLPDPASRLSLIEHLYAYHRLRDVPSFRQTGAFSSLTRGSGRRDPGRVRTLVEAEQGTITWWGADESRTLSGVSGNLGEGLFYPHAGVVDPRALCQHLVTSHRIECRYGQMITGITRTGNSWRIDAGDGPPLEADLVVVAAGYGAAALTDSAYLPIDPLRGQTAIVPASSDLGGIRHVLSAGVTIFPADEGVHHIAATHNPGDAGHDYRPAEHRLLIRETAAMLDAQLPPSPPSGHVGVRAVTPDRHPFVGRVPDWDRAIAHFSPLRRNARARVPPADEPDTGLYVSTGYGSRGLSRIPLCSEHLASLICEEPSPLAPASERLVDPTRILIRKLKRQLI